MIYFTPGGSVGYIVASTVYGNDGRKELEALYKKLNVKKDVYKDIGSPCNERLIIPASKEASLINHGAVKVDPTILSAAIQAKVQTWQKNMATLASNATRKPPSTYTTAFDADDEPIRHNRRDDDRRGSHKEKIRQERRNNSKREFPDGKDADDDE